MLTIIDTLIERHKQISEFLRQQGQISLEMNINDDFRKVLVLSIASYFESSITESILVLAKNTNMESIWSFIKNKAVSRQYHTYFDWDRTNINKFLKLFGDSFQNSVSEEIDKNTNLKKGAENFLKLGYHRNVLVHENFASAPLNLSIEEIITMYFSALAFTQFLSDKIKNQQPPKIKNTELEPKTTQNGLTQDQSIQDKFKTDQ